MAIEVLLAGKALTMAKRMTESMGLSIYLFVNLRAT